MAGTKSGQLLSKELPDFFGRFRGVYEAFVPARHDRNAFVEAQGAHRTHVDIAAQNFYLRVLRA